ncbi:hypothetical protein NA56DRAFT_499571 [Hyaloscypha hepaticicola]|uniref:Uncharacterized protein n=1 Tax=Hyaloscypha hepaticicola TaxID=2082293 RepID=A0A2J6PE31_9HELO|nr:hypothetical protein NA56DRAFT_499571 [Hyaloscypha hepaticicola]
MRSRKKGGRGEEVIIIVVIVRHRDRTYAKMPLSPDKSERLRHYINSPSFEPCRRALKQVETISAPPTRECFYNVILQHLEANANGEFALSLPQLASVVLETWKAGNDLRAEMETRVGVRDEAVMNSVKEEYKEEEGIHAVNEEAVTNTVHSSNPNPNTNLDHRPRPPFLRLRPKPNVGRRRRGTQPEAKRIRIPMTAKATVHCQNTLPDSTTAKANVNRQYSLPNFLRILLWLVSFLLPPLVVLLPRFWVPVLQYLSLHFTDVLGPLVKYILPLISGFLSPAVAQIADLFQQLVKIYCDAFHLPCTDSSPDCEPITTTTITLPPLPCPTDCHVTPSTITLLGPCSLVDFDVLSSSVSVVFTSPPLLPISAGSLFLPSSTYSTVILPSLFLPSSTCSTTPSASVFLNSPLPPSPSFDSGFDLVVTPFSNAKLRASLLVGRSKYIRNRRSFASALPVAGLPYVLFILAFAFYLLYSSTSSFANRRHLSPAS